MISFILNTILILLLIAVGIFVLLFLLKWGLVLLTILLIALVNTPFALMKRPKMWFIQFPVLIIQALIIFSTYTQGNLWDGILIAVLLQVSASVIMFKPSKRFTPQTD